MGRSASLHLPRPFPCRPSPLFLGRRPTPLCRSRKFEFLDLLNYKHMFYIQATTLTIPHRSTQHLLRPDFGLDGEFFSSLVFSLPCIDVNIQAFQLMTIQLPPGLTPWSVLVGESRCNSPISGALIGKIPTNASFPSTHD